jgi:hypothetical protein
MYPQEMILSPGNLVAPPCECELAATDDNWFHNTKCPVAKSLRQEWCTPKWLADLIGPVDLDPCTNERSWVRASEYHWETFSGLDPIQCYPAAMRVFINPPYGPGSVSKWVQMYNHTRFIFLLRWDPSTDWFAQLYPHCTHIWHPGERINFEPPPRIRASSNAYPHALFMRDPDQDLLSRLAARGGYLNEV